MPEETSNSNSNLDTVLGQLKQANAESAQRRAKLKQSAAEIADLKTKLAAKDGDKDGVSKQLTDLTADRDSWKVKAEAAPNELASEVDRLKGVIRDGKHREAFKGLYEDKELKLNKQVPIDDLWATLGYKAETDDVDLAAVKAKVVGLRESKPYLFMGETPPTTRELPPGPGAHRGTTDDTAGGWVTVTKAQTRDPVFMLENQARMAVAVKEKRFRIEG